MLHFLDCVESRVTVWSGFFSLIEQCWYISMLDWILYCSCVLWI